MLLLLLGENGSGKSSITRLILRLLNLLKEDTFNEIKCFLILEINNSKIIIQNNIKINYNTENFINFKDFTCQEYNLNKELFSLLLDFTLSRFGLKNQEDDKYKTDYALEPSKLTYAKTHHDKINTEAVTGNIKNFGFLGYLYLSSNNNLPKNIPKVTNVQLKPRSGKARISDFNLLSQNNNFKSVLSKFITNQNFTTLNVLDTEIKKSELIEINTLNEIKNNLYLVFPLYDFELIFDTNGKFDSLSSGQTFLLCYVGYIIKYIEYCKNNNKTSCTIIIDECETSLHPNWQKESVKFFIDAIKSEIEDNFKINLIFTSHSPFILSDIPKENVIFLDKFHEKETKNKYPKLDTKDLKIGNCINVSKHIELKTFGANIHTLLSNGFFMSDGLMGEFAKSKITEIKDFYNENKDLKNEDSKFESKKDEFKKNKKYFENIQKIIGEPFLQTIIKNYLDELEILFNGKKEFLDKEIKRLEELRNELK
jgi:energy-coupling factor transporter ATP-binding protein EcfA2